MSEFANKGEKRESKTGKLCDVLNVWSLRAMGRASGATSAIDVGRRTHETRPSICIHLFLLLTCTCWIWFQSAAMRHEWNMGVSPIDVFKSSALIEGDGCAAGPLCTLRCQFPSCNVNVHGALPPKRLACSTTATNKWAATARVDNQSREVFLS